MYYVTNNFIKYFEEKIFTNKMHLVVYSYLIKLKLTKRFDFIQIV